MTGHDEFPNWLSYLPSSLNASQERWRIRAHESHLADRAFSRSPSTVWLRGVTAKNVGTRENDEFSNLVLISLLIWGCVCIYLSFSGCVWYFFPTCKFARCHWERSEMFFASLEGFLSRDCSACRIPPVRSLIGTVDKPQLRSSEALACGWQTGERESCQDFLILSPAISSILTRWIYQRFPTKTKDGTRKRKLHGTTIAEGSVHSSVLVNRINVDHVVIQDTLDQLDHAFTRWFLFLIGKKSNTQHPKTRNKKLSKFYIYFPPCG